jgi:hypothetical protein
MDETTMIIVAAAFVAIVAIAVVVWMSLRKSQTARLHSKFGPEYDRVAAVEGGRSAAEKTLHEREKRVEKLNLVPLFSAEEIDSQGRGSRRRLDSWTIQGPRWPVPTG